MKYYYIVVDNGGDTLEGIVSEDDYNAFLAMDITAEIRTCLDLDNLKTIVAQIEEGEADITIEGLKEFDEGYFSGGS